MVRLRDQVAWGPGLSPSLTTTWDDLVSLGLSAIIWKRGTITLSAGSQQETDTFSN